MHVKQIVIFFFSKNLRRKEIKQVLFPEVWCKFDMNIIIFFSSLTHTNACWDVSFLQIILRCENNETKVHPFSGET